MQESKSIRLHIGQILKLEEKNRNGDMIRKMIQVKKIYRHHVLCRVNGTYNECFSYAEILQAAVGMYD